MGICGNRISRIETDDLAASNQEGRQRGAHFRQIKRGENVIQPGRRRPWVWRKQHPLTRIQPPAERGLSHQRKEQVAVVFNVECADEADTSWRLVESGHGFPRAFTGCSQ